MKFKKNLTHLWKQNLRMNHPTDMMKIRVWINFPQLPFKQWSCINWTNTWSIYKVKRVNKAKHVFRMYLLEAKAFKAKIHLLGQLPAKKGTNGSQSTLWEKTQSFKIFTPLWNSKLKKKGKIKNEKLKSTNFRTH